MSAVEGLEGRLCLSVGATVVVRPDPVHPGLEELVVWGTDENDVIRLSRANAAEDMRVHLNGVRLEIYRDGVSVGTTVHVDGRLVVHGLDGADRIEVASDHGNDAWLYGGEGRDLLTLGPSGGIAFGGGLDDRLIGRRGRDILIGGVRDDTIWGGGGQDAIVAGPTAADDPSSPDHDAAFAALLAEWSRTDIGYGHRVEHIREGGGVDGLFLLDDDSVLNDEGQDRMSGEEGRDFFTRDLNDYLVDDESNEIVQVVEGPLVQRVILPEQERVGTFVSEAVQIPGDATAIRIDLLMPDSERGDPNTQGVTNVFASVNGTSDWVLVQGPSGWTGGTSVSKFFPDGPALPVATGFAFGPGENYRGFFIRVEVTTDLPTVYGVALTVLNS